MAPENLYESEAYLAFKTTMNGWLATLRQHITEVTRATYPTAAALMIEVTYGDDGDTGVTLRGVRDANGESLADNDVLTTREFDKLCDDLWEPLNNINDLDPIVVTGDEGELELGP